MHPFGRDVDQAATLDPLHLFGTTRVEDPCLTTWKNGGGVYATNGGVAAVIKKSSQVESTADGLDAAPDLFIFCIPGKFPGYYPGYANYGVYQAGGNDTDPPASRSVDTSTDDHKHVTWAILKGHTRNTAGTVKLRTRTDANGHAYSDPRDTPLINFHYFQEGTDADGKDLTAVAEAVRFVRGVNRTARELMLGVLAGGATRKSGRATIARQRDADDDASVKDWVKKEAWGHHASCTCPIGTDPDQGLRACSMVMMVWGTANLRVVDASVFS